MLPETINNAIKAYLQLNVKDREFFLDYVTERSIPYSERELIEEKFADGFECPHCHAKGKGVSKAGKTARGKQRYKCQHCGKTFSATTGGVLFQSKKPISKWREFVSCFLHGFTVRKTAEVIGIHRNTAFLWRHKICDSLNNILQEVTLSGLVEADETYFRVSCKGGKVEGRKPRKRGSSIFHKGRKRGLSDEQVCVPCAVNRSGQSVSKVAEVGKSSANGIKAVITPYIAEGSTLCVDGEKAYKRIALESGLTYVQVGAVGSKRGGYSIQHVNAYHRGLKQFVEKFWGVSTKHLNNYLLWFNFSQYAKETYTEKARLLTHHILTTNCYTRRVDIPARPIIPYICENVRKAA